MYIVILRPSPYECLNKCKNKYNIICIVYLYTSEKCNIKNSEHSQTIL